jgi:glycosyltransferase involved in cell wall biosynthesis
MPFAHESFGIAALEAMGFGLPVIGSSAGGVAEFVRHGENGFRVAPGDRESLRRHIAALHRDRELLASMGAAAFDTGSAWPSWEQSMEPACVFLEKLLES